MDKEKILKLISTNKKKIKYLEIELSFLDSCCSEDDDLMEYTSETISNMYYELEKIKEHLTLIEKELITY